MRNLLSVAVVVGLLLAVPLATEARSRSRGSEVDVAVTGVTAPSTAGVGQNVTIEATITAAGGRATSADIELAVSPGGETRQQEISITDGETRTVAFSWTPDSAGTYTATVTAETGNDPDTSNNSGSAEIDVLSGDAVVVSDLSANIEGTNQISGSVEIATGNTSDSRYRRRSGVSNAEVTVEYSTPDGRTGTTVVTTDSGGAASFEFLVEGNGSVPNCYTVTVTDVEAAGSDYSAGDASSTKVYPEPTALYSNDGDDGSIIKFDLNGNELARENPEEGYDGIVTNLNGQVFAVNSSEESIEIFNANLNQIGEFDLQDDADTYGLAIDSEGILYVSHEDGPETVVKYDQQGNVLGSWEEDLLDEGDDLAIGPDGLVYVADAEEGVKVFDKDGNLQRSFDPQGDQDAESVTFDCQGNLYLATNDEVEVYDSEGMFQRYIGENVFDEADYVLVGGAEQRIYVSDPEDEVVQVFNQDGNLIETIDGSYESNDLAFAY